MSKPTTTVYLKIGEVAERTGTSAKALRLYEARGLLQSVRSGNGYRRYDARALARLSEIRLLQRAGFTLAEISQLLEREGSAAALIETKIVALRQRVDDGTRALQALEQARSRLASTSHDIDQLLETIKMNDNLEMQFTAAERAEYQHRAGIFGKHFNDEQKTKMRHVAEDLGHSGRQQLETESRELTSAVRAAMDAHTPPTDPQVMELARRWYAMILAMTSGDAALGRAIGKALASEPDEMATQGIDPAMILYVQQAMQAAGVGLPGKLD